MTQIEELSEKLINISNDNTRSIENKKLSHRIILQTLLIDSLNLYKNIQETSLNNNDEELRINNFCDIVGINRINKISNRF